MRVVYHPRLGEGYVQTWYQGRRRPAQGSARPMTAYRAGFRPQAEYAALESRALAGFERRMSRARRGRRDGQRGTREPLSEGHDLRALALPGRRPKSLGA